jgi:hypothetical protein
VLGGVDSNRFMKNFCCSLGRYVHVWEGNILIKVSV